MSEVQIEPQQNVENVLVEIGYGIFISSILGLVALIILVVGARDPDWVNIIYGIVIVGIGLTVRVLFGAIAEIIRLLREQTEILRSKE